MTKVEFSIRLVKPACEKPGGAVLREDWKPRPLAFAQWAIKPLDIDTHELGLDMAERYGFSIYDGLIVAAAMRARCSIP